MKVGNQKERFTHLRSIGDWLELVENEIEANILLNNLDIHALY